MRFSVQLPTDRVDAGDEFIGVDAISALAPAIERAGFDACYVTEHPFPPDRWLRSGGHHALDPFVSLSAAAMVTRTLRLHTNILVLSYRNPFLLAKAIASLDVLSSGRVILGVAAGYLEEEFRALGASFEDRNAVSDEALEAMKAAWAGDSVVFSGDSVAHAAGQAEHPRFEAVGNTMRPAPVQKPHPPIWVGGNSERAMRRAVQWGQGWSPFPLPRAGTAQTRTAAIESLEDLDARIRRLHEIARDAGRSEPIDVNFVPFGLRMNSDDAIDVAALLEQLEHLEAMGVTWVSVGLPGRSRAAYLDAISAFGEQILKPAGAAASKQGVAS
jgi:probable F420-dependent oxidoreductase